MLTFEDVCDRTDARTRSLLTANGFSIACSRSFSYTTLLEKADFGPRGRERRLRALFRAVETADFEGVVRRLEEAADTIDRYSGSEDLVRRLTRDASAVRDGLAAAIADVHSRRIGDVGDARLEDCNEFLKSFAAVYTLNYDALLHWARMRAPGMFDDGFRRRDDRLVHAEPDRQTIFWLHGALHLTTQSSLLDPPTTVKASWAEDGPLIDHVRDEIHAGRFPLLVTEGTWKQKARAIGRSPYLSHGLDRLRCAVGSLVTYGWGMNTNDRHILDAIVESDITHLFLGVRPRASAVEVANVKASGSLLRARTAKRLTVRVWDTATANPW
jgi:hypothetical protein